MSSARGRVRCGSRTSHHRQQERREPDRGALGQHAARRARGRAAEREAEQHQQRQGGDLERGAQVLENRPSVNPQIVHHPDDDDVARAEQLLGPDVQRPHGGDDGGGVRAESAQGVGRGGDPDGAEGARADHPQLRPHEEEGGEGTERLTHEDVHAARARERRGQLRVGERPAQHHGAAHHPGKEEERDVVHALRDAGRRAEDAAADGRADEDGDGAPQAEPAG